MELEHSIGFSGEVKSALHLHPNGSTIVYALGGGVIIASLDDPHEQTFLRGHDDSITCLTLSKSGKYIVSGQRGDNSDVIVWDVESRREMYRFQEHDLGVLLVQMSDDERFLLTVGADKKMVVWDMLSGMIVVKQSGVKHTSCACWGGRRRDKKGRLTTDFQLVTGGDGNLTYWTLNPHEGSLVAEECSLGNQVRHFTSLAFSHDEEYIFAGSSSSDFTAVHIKHKVMHSTTMCSSGGVRAMVVMQTAVGDRVVVGCGDGSITVYEGMRNGAQTCRSYTRGPVAACSQTLDGAVSAIALSPSGDGRLHMIAGTERGTVYEVSLAYADEHAMYAKPATSAIKKQSHWDKVVAVSYPRGNSNFFATASDDGTLRVWDVNSFEVLSRANCQPSITGAPICLDFTGEVLFSGWRDGKIRAHNAEDGDDLWVIDNCHRHGATSIQASNNRKFLVSGGEEGEVRVWETRTREMIVHLKQHTGAVTSLALFDDDSHLVSSSQDRTIYLWDLQAESRKTSLVMRMGGINAICLLADHVQLVSVGQDKLISYWDLRERDPVHQLPIKDQQQPIAEQLCLATYTPPSTNGESGETVFATGGMDHVVRIWSFKSGALISEGAGHTAAVRGIKFSPDGKQLVSVGEDGAVLVWNIFLDDPPPPQPA
eukprot:CAMPEP_0174709378 /NCGR_PEP_ID=MMETSP1094-20130205/11355_1 /TAXON_ID=156173 /ORGANISM="Chrysochromulina brevifilum, Strain UTEX LB 985" /LENGTH=653 /DNA_ID=CAMNT_0015908051 /DNA_START=37 /DNA_END=1998 /DNA_ORIENTATION=-